MDELMLICLSTVVLGSGPLLFFGYLVAVKQKRHLINGVDQSRLSNPEGFGRFVGHSLTFTGLLISLVALFLYIGAIGIIGFAGALVIVSLLPLPCLFYAKQKFS